MTDDQNPGAHADERDEEPEPSFETTSAFPPVLRPSEGWDSARSTGTHQAAAPWERSASGAHAREDEPGSDNRQARDGGSSQPARPQLDPPTENISIADIKRISAARESSALSDEPPLEHLQTAQFRPVQRPPQPSGSPFDAQPDFDAQPNYDGRGFFGSQGAFDQGAYQYGSGVPQGGFPPGGGSGYPPPWHPGPDQAQAPQPQSGPFPPDGYQYAGLAPEPPVPAAPPTIDEVGLARDTRKAPTKGWRKLIYKMSGGSIKPAESADDIALKALIERVRHPVNGDYRVAVLSLKGGVGKTTTTVGLGATFASLRGDRVIAVDANPDFGTLAQRGPLQTRSTVRDLLHDDKIYRYSDVRAYTSQGPSRLEIVASERDPAVSEAFSGDDYRGVIKVLQRFYNIILTDCGTGLMHSAMSAILDEANAIVLVSSPAIDAARSASATLDWLDHHGYSHLVQRAVVVLSSARPGAATVDVDQLTQHFLGRARAVHQIPFDDHLAEGAELDLDVLSNRTRRALIELAATVADDFGVPRILNKAEPDDVTAASDVQNSDSGTHS